MQFSSVDVNWSKIRRIIHELIAADRNSPGEPLERKLLMMGIEPQQALRVRRTFVHACAGGRVKRDSLTEMFAILGLIW